MPRSAGTRRSGRWRSDPFRLKYAKGRREAALSFCADLAFAKPGRFAGSEFQLSRRISQTMQSVGGRQGEA